MEERSLRIVDSNKTFFGKLSNTLSRIIVPTKIGMNSLVINLKRNNLIKTYEANVNFKDNINDAKKNSLKSKYQEAYSIYLEAIDKYIMDSVYKKVKAKTASDFEKEAMGNYYQVTKLKENDYVEYKYRKQKYLIELDYESLKLNSKEKILKRYTEFYITQMDSFYKGILKTYSVKLADTSKKIDNKSEVYTNIFDTLNEYMEKILPLKIENGEDNIESRVGNSYRKLEQFEVGKLDAKEQIEKNILLLGISRQIFTHSLPLVAAEQCYEKLIEDNRQAIVNAKTEKSKLEAYNLLMDLLETYYIKFLSTKVYWEKIDEKTKFKEILEKYQNAKTIKEKEIIFLKKEINTIDNESNKEIIKFYKNRLVSYGVMRNIKNSCRTSSNYTKR